MKFSWVLKAYPQKAWDGDSQAEHYGLGRWQVWGKKRTQQSSRRRRRNYQKEQAQEGKAVGRSQPATRWAGAAQRTGARGGSGRKEACACREGFLLIGFEKSRAAQAPEWDDPRHGGYPAGGSLPPPGGRCWRKTETQNGFEEPGPRNCHSQGGSKKANPGMTEALQEVRWGEAGGVLPLGLDCSRNSPSPRSITRQAPCCTLNIPSPV